MEEEKLKAKKELEEANKNNKVIIAKNLFKTSLSNDEIAQNTGLTIVEIEILRKNN